MYRTRGVRQAAGAFFFMAPLPLLSESKPAGQ
jgi:hypothetical protein